MDSGQTIPAEIFEDIISKFEHVTYEVMDTHIAVLTISRPDALNALNGQVLLEISAAFEVAEANADIQALIITGEGRAFVAGADISQLHKLEDSFGAREASLIGQDVMNTLASLPMPTIAALNGFALGGGLELALACDMRVASPQAKVGLPEVSLGIIPGYGGTQRLARLIGQGRALDLIMTGRHVGAEEALQLGLVNRVVDDALQGALELAHACIKNAPIALGLAKEALIRGYDVTLGQGLEIEADMFGMACTTQDAKEGMSAFLEKRAAAFKGE